MSTFHLYYYLVASCENLRNMTTLASKSKLETETSQELTIIMMKDSISKQNHN